NLHLPNNNIQDISELRNLKYLNFLSLWDNQILDISPLENLKYLSYLDLESNKIKDVTKLRNLSNLETLYLYDNPLDFENKSSMETIRALQDAGVNVYFDSSELYPSLNAYVESSTDTSLNIGW